MNWDGKTVWITGASSGIGEALAKGIADRGAAVILSGRRVMELERVAADVAGAKLILPFEVTDYGRLEGLVSEAWGWRNGIDLLINNAGISQRSLAIDTEFSVYRQLMEIDFFAPLRLTQVVLPYMVERRSGHIAIVSSVAGKVGAPLRSGYSAAKHACIGYFDALRAEVEMAYGIDVSVILPGSVRTSVAINALAADGTTRGESDVNIEGGMAPERAARMILDGLIERKREIVVAEGIEGAALNLRNQDPELLFSMTAQEGAKLAAARQNGARPDSSSVKD